MSERDSHSDPEHDADVARLLGLADAAAAPPAAVSERVRQAARASFRHELRHRARRRVLVAAVGLAAAGAFALVMLRTPSSPPPAPAPALVEALAGPLVSRQPSAAGRPRSLATGEAVERGTELETGAAGGAAIRLPSAHSVRLAPATTVRLGEDGNLSLTRGALYVDSGFEAHAALPIAVATALGVVRELGTQFEVRLEAGSLVVRLREGNALLERNGEAHSIGANSELRLAADGSVARRPLAPDASEWDWLAPVTPMIELDGRSARSFLDWVARERGLELAFDDAATASAARTTRLGGTARGLTLDQALDAVLPSCRLAYRIEGGVLRVATAP